MKKKDKAKLKSYRKAGKCKCDCMSDSWVSHMVDFHFGQESVYDKFPIPLSVSKVGGFRFILPVTPAGPGGMAGWLTLEYDSDVENTDFDTSVNEHGLYRHKILNKDLNLGAITEPHLIDELFSFDLKLKYNNVHYLNVIYLVEGKADTGIDVHPVVSFKFEGCKCCKGGKKVFNFNF